MLQDDGLPPPQERSPVAFALLNLVLSLPFWALGFLDIQILPGLPISGLQFVCPGFAAFLLVYRQRGSTPAFAFLKRMVDRRRVRPATWYFPTLLLMPAASVLAYAGMRWFARPLPASVDISVTVALILLPLLLFAGLCEELGWSGYLLGALQARSSRVSATVLLGAYWGAWHVLPLIQAHRPVTWIAWWFTGTLVARFLLVWLYTRAGYSVFAAGLCHATQNLAWQLFPNRGSHYDPQFSALGLAAVLAIVLITARAPGRNPVARVG